MSDITFGRPLLLLLLVFVPIALAWWWIGLARGARAASQISRSRPSRPAYLASVLLAIAAGSAIIAASQPRWGTRSTAVPRTGAELIVVLDISRSMDAKDVPPSRLEAAKSAILATFARLSGDRAGVVIFAGDALLRFPLTGDMEAASQVVASLETGVILVEGGSSAASGLDVALEAFDTEHDTGRAVLLVTDGDDLGGDPAGAISRLRAAGVTLLVAGVGTPEGATVPVYDATRQRFVDKLDAAGKPIISRLNEVFLRTAATAAGGRYLGNDPQAIPGAVSATLASLERTRIEERATDTPIERFPWFAGAAMAALVLASVVERLPRIRLRRAVLGGAVSLLALFMAGCATEAYRVNEAGRDAFAAGDIDAAISLFYEAQVLDPDDAGISLNLAAALATAGRHEEASVAARRALLSNDDAIRARAHASLGHHQFALEQYPASLEAFKQALLLDPDDDNSRHDYEVVLRLLNPPDPPPTPPPGKETPTPGPGETPQPGDGTGEGSPTPGPGQGTPRPGASASPGPGDSRPGDLQELEQQIQQIDNQVRRLLQASGDDPTPEQALEILRLLAERSRLSALRDAFRGGGRPGDY